MALFSDPDMYLLSLVRFSKGRLPPPPEARVQLRARCPVVFPLREFWEDTGSAMRWRGFGSLVGKWDTYCLLCRVERG